MNFTLFFLQFSNEFHSLRCPVKKSCSYKVVTYWSEVCLNSHPLHCSHYYIEEVEHTLEEYIWMFHHGSDAGHPDIPAYALNRQWMIPHGSIHGSTDAIAFRTEISLITVTHNAGNAEIDL